MRSAAEKDAWLTLKEIAAATRYGEASISAQLRNLRKDGETVLKRYRPDQYWEYQVKTCS
jgi:biotin operon repressor